MFKNVWSWIKMSWQGFKPTVKKVIFYFIDTQLEPALAYQIDLRKKEIISSLDKYDPGENAKKLCDWIKEYIEKHL